MFHRSDATSIPELKRPGLIEGSSRPVTTSGVPATIPELKRPGLIEGSHGDHAGEAREFYSRAETPGPN